MKKIVLLILILFLTGCGSKYIKCTTDIDNESLNYKFHAEYKIYYKDKYVTKIVKNEKYTTDNKNRLNYLKEYKELEYDMLSKSYGGYKYKVTTSKEAVRIKTTITAKNLNVKRMVDDKIIDKYYTSNNKILLSGLKKHYESKSAVCK